MEILEIIVHYWATILLVLFLPIPTYALIKLAIYRIRLEVKKSKIYKGQTYVWVQLEGDPFKDTSYTYAEIIDFHDGYISFMADGQEMSSTDFKFFDRFEPYDGEYIQ